MSFNEMLSNPEGFKKLIEHDREVGTGYVYDEGIVYMVVNGQGPKGHRSVGAIAVPDIQGAVVCQSTQQDATWRIGYVLLGSGAAARRIPVDAKDKFGSDALEDALPHMRFGNMVAPTIIGWLDHARQEAIGDRLRKAGEDAKVSS